MSPQLKRLSKPPSKNPQEFMRRCRILFCPVISGFPLGACTVVNVRALPRALIQGVYPFPPTCLLLPGGGLEGLEWEGDVCQAFPLLAHTRGCLKAHLQLCSLPWPFQLAALAMKPLNLTRSTQALNGRLLKQIFCAFSVLASELAPGCLQGMAYRGVCSETWQESLLRGMSRSFHETVACA